MKQSRLVLFLILLLVIPVLACNAVTGALNDSEAEATAENAIDALTEDSAESPDTGAEEAASGPETLTLETLASGLEGVNSYRVSIVMRVEGSDGSGGTETVSLTMENATVIDPPATEMNVNVEGIDDALGVSSLQFITIGDTVYSTLPGVGCISGDASATGSDISANPFGDIFAAGDFIGDVEGARRQLPDENINGVETYHFVFDESAIQDPNSGIDQVDGHIYISKEEGYVVRLVMDGTGRIDIAGTGQESEGNIHLEMNTSDVNQPIDILPPENCDSFNLDDLELPDIDFGGDAADAPYPVFADNQEFFLLDEIMSFQTTASFEDVVAFYQAEMPIAGFEPVSDGSVLTDNAAVLKFSQGGRNYFVTISEDGGTVFVQVVPE